MTWTGEIILTLNHSRQFFILLMLYILPVFILWDLVNSLSAGLDKESIQETDSAALSLMRS